MAPIIRYEDEKKLGDFNLLQSAPVFIFGGKNDEIIPKEMVEM